MRGTGAGVPRAHSAAAPHPGLYVLLSADRSFLIYYPANAALAGGGFEYAIRSTIALLGGAGLSAIRAFRLGVVKSRKSGNLSGRSGPPAVGSTGVPGSFEQERFTRSNLETTQYSAHH